MIRGKHLRYLGNRNKIVRVRNFEFDIQISSIETALCVTYQEAFEMVVQEMDSSRCAMREAATRIILKVGEK